MRDSEKRGRQVCSRCVLDTSDPDIQFDAKGVCNHCREEERRRSEKRPSPHECEQQLARIVEKLKSRGRSREYDCLLGISGGVDSSYVAYLAHQLGLRCLVVHMDNGWNSELAVENIRGIIEKLDFDLVTHVINWGEFRDLQRSFFKASVIDIEVLTDHAIFGTLSRLARKHRLHYVLSGGNAATESGLPKAWAWNKLDARNIRAIHKQFGEKPLRTYPITSTWEWALKVATGSLRYIKVLNLVPYRKDKAMQTLESELGWRYYGGKHYESTFTKFYQAYVLPNKFGVDKRKAHLSSLIRNGEITRDDARKELDKPLYQPDELRRDKEYVLKKLGFTEEEFRLIMSTPPKSHLDYPSDARFHAFAKAIATKLRKGI